MIILACETSTILGSVAILEDDKVLSFEESPRKNSHSDNLNIFIENVLLKSGKKLSDIDLFASGIGPGSFTGIRISLNAIKTMGYCFNKPVVGINSLFNLATNCLNTLKSQTFPEKQNEVINFPIIPMINAYKNMVYLAVYKYDKNTLVEIKKPEVVRVQNLSEYFEDKTIVCGDGYLTYENFISENVKRNMIRLLDISDEPHAIITGRLAFNHDADKHGWANLVPLYLRASEAEENQKGIKYQQLV